jgi:hypothetical protein
MGFNNPAAEVDYEAKSLWDSRSVGVLISIGTGLQTIPSIKKSASWLPFGLGVDIVLASALASMATSTARVDNEMQRMYSSTSTKYYRFDVDSGMANISLEQWMKEDEMSALTEQYMHDPRQSNKSKQIAEQLVKLSALPPQFEIQAQTFHVGIKGQDLENESFSMTDIDLKTGFQLGLSVTPERAHEIALSHSPPGRAGITVDIHGSSKKVIPVLQDLDRDGRKEESTVLTCNRTENICLRALRQGIPQGKYKVKWIAAFTETEQTPPTEVIFSVGKPYDSRKFVDRYVDVQISPDIVTVLLHPDAVRVRVGRKRYAEKKDRSWVEIEGDQEIEVGLDGELGFVISKKFEEGVFVGGWHFGGVRVIPV